MEKKNDKKCITPYSIIKRKFHSVAELLEITRRPYTHHENFAPSLKKKSQNVEKIGQFFYHFSKDYVHDRWHTILNKNCGLTWTRCLNWVYVCSATCLGGSQRQYELSAEFITEFATDICSPYRVRISLWKLVNSSLKSPT